VLGDCHAQAQKTDGGKAVIGLGKSEATARLIVMCSSLAKRPVDLLVKTVPFDRRQNNSLLERLKHRGLRHMVNNGGGGRGIHSHFMVRCEPRTESAGGVWM